MTEFWTLIWEILVGTNDPNLHLAMVWQAAAISAGASLLGGKKQRKAARRESGLAREERAKQQAILEKQKQEYRDIEFTNPYEGMQNQYAENVYEDLTVNQQQAQFQTQQGQQQRANIMGGLRGAAGTSGIAGLAQAMANQGQIQAQQISGSIGMQEARNQQLRAQGDQQRQRGAAAVDLSIRGGDAMLQQAESGRQATLLGVAQGGAAGANAAYQQQMLNQAKANASSSSMTTSAITGLVGADWGSLSGGGGGGGATAGPPNQWQTRVSTSGDYNDNGIPDLLEPR